MISQLVTMLDMQDAMNAKVHSHWRQQGFAWYRAIWTECAELMEHYGWKWWKKQTPDLDQVKLELVDIWHFGLSIRLLTDDDHDALAANIAAELGEARPGGEFRQLLEAFTLDVLASKSFDAKLFAALLAAVDMDFDELYVRYMGKNVLNFFRQDNGYRDGSYQKHWHGKEDNEHLVEIVALLDASSATFKEDIYTSLAARYRSA